ncbi:hypothetical protein [Streptomyces sp. NPDC001274]
MATRTSDPTNSDMSEALRRTAADPVVRPRRLIAAGIKRGNHPFTIKAVA